MRASVMGGWLFCAVLALATVSCGKKRGSPDWDTPGGSETYQTPAAPIDVPAPDPALSEPEAVSSAGGTKASPSTKPISGGAGLRFVAYNVENWLTMDRYVNHQAIKGESKPESEKNALIEILVANSPDVLGICEIGEASDLAEIQESLKAAGVNLPHSHYTGGSDPVRHLGLLSRYPITSTSKITELEYQIHGKTFGFGRGVLDASITANGKSYRFLGVHLKSKREVEDGDQEQMRIHEAHLLRKHVDEIFKTDPQARLLVYGDFNDTYPSKTVRAITGSPDENQRLTPIYMKDSRGEAWTHHWKNQDIYSRIDFVTLSGTLRSEVDFKACHVIDDPKWDEASDHRPLVVVFK